MSSVLPPPPDMDQRSPPVFTFVADPGEAMDAYNELRAADVISAQSHALLDALTQLAADDKERRTDFVSLVDILNISRSTLLRRLNPLLKSGLVEKHAGASHKGKHTEFVFSDPRNVKGLTNGEGESSSQFPARWSVTEHDREIIESQRPLDLSRKADGDFIPEELKFSIKGEALSILGLFSALPSSPKSALAEQGYVTNVHIGPYRMQVEVRPQQGLRTVTALDLRVLAAIITLVHRQIAAGTPAVNPFFIRVDSIIELFRRAGDVYEERERGGKAKRSILGSIERWETTQFRITHVPESIQNFYHGMIRVRTGIRFISKVADLSKYDGRHFIPERLGISLDEELLRRIKDPSGRFLASMTREWLIERNPTALMLSTFCRRFIQHGHSPRTLSREFVHAETDPKRPQREFYRSLRTLFSERFVASKGAALINGYYFLIERGPPERYVIWADPEHQTLGTRSYKAYIDSRGDERGD
ncbi:hypothetical protein J2T57_001268 [Natronocella acetinitrilica]|uniref:Uncharacterized protein n=1 Tax=Natronocella acetinitrilica TaxID=414046 RepID=A0AAE3KB30_9GAMM|nr:hypothetical protein [Natronocella acetinitrilica]MCP1674166.1 hypothetical protein [Natronocella acetinitrilica]